MYLKRRALISHRTNDRSSFSKPQAANPSAKEENAFWHWKSADISRRQQQDNLNKSHCGFRIRKKLLSEINQKTTTVIAIRLAGYLSNLMN
jgi:phosphatidylethanolamine-binding protein (PEBP) family uncharacterized protein